MSETKRKNFTGEFKAKVALEAIRGIKKGNEIGQEFEVHPGGDRRWHGSWCIAANPRSSYVGWPVCG